MQQNIQQANITVNDSSKNCVRLFPENLNPARLLKKDKLPKNIYANEIKRIKTDVANILSGAFKSKQCMPVFGVVIDFIAEMSLTHNSFTGQAAHCFLSHESILDRLDCPISKRTLIRCIAELGGKCVDVICSGVVQKSVPILQKTRRGKRQSNLYTTPILDTLLYEAFQDKTAKIAAMEGVVEKTKLNTRSDTVSPEYLCSTIVDKTNTTNTTKSEVIANTSENVRCVVVSKNSKPWINLPDKFNSPEISAERKIEGANKYIEKYISSPEQQEIAKEEFADKVDTDKIDKTNKDYLSSLIALGSKGKLKWKPRVPSLNKLEDLEENEQSEFIANILKKRYKLTSGERGDLEAVVFLFMLKYSSGKITKNPEAFLASLARLALSNELDRSQFIKHMDAQNYDEKKEELSDLYKRGYGKIFSSANTNTPKPRKKPESPPHLSETAPRPPVYRACEHQKPRSAEDEAMAAATLGAIFKKLGIRKEEG